MKNFILKRLKNNESRKEIGLRRKIRRKKKRRFRKSIHHKSKMII